MPQRLNGRVHGSINGVSLNDLDMHTYVVTTDGRTYTAISRVPAALGPAMETLSTVGGAIGWLFAVPSSSQALNGFSYTGLFCHMLVCMKKCEVRLQEIFEP